MRFHVLTEHLQKKLSFINHAVSPRSQLPILLNLLFEVKNNKLTISATDLEIGIQVEIPVNQEREGIITIPAKIITELIGSLPNEKISFELKENNLEIKSKKTKTTLQTAPGDEFPKLYEEKGEEIVVLKGEEIRDDFSKVVFAASVDTTRPALSGILVKNEEKEGGFLLVATDGYRLSLKSHLSEKKKEVVWEKPLLVPARVIKEVLLVKDGEGQVRVYTSKRSNQILFYCGDVIVVGRLIEAEFPNYQKIIPTTALTQVIFDREELQKAVKICVIFARETANIVKLNVKKDTIMVSANTPSVGENIVEVEAKVTGDENEIAFNARYLLDFLANIDKEEMVFEMNGALSPGVFKIKDDPTFLHIIMPIRVQG